MQDVSAVRRFFVDPYRPNLLYVLDSSSIKRSDDGGRTWQTDWNLQVSVTGGGRIPIERPDASGESDHYVEVVLADMQFDPYQPLMRFAVGEGGVFFTTDGVTWNRLLDTGALPGRPTNCYYDWVSNPCQRALYVGFAGRSVVKISPLPWGPLESPDPALWSTNVVVPGHESKSTPTLALFQGVMHMVRNNGSGNALIWSTSPDGVTWSAGQIIPGQKSKAGASIAALGNVLHMVHLGDSSNHIWWSTNDGTGWTPNVQISNQLSQTPPVLVVYEGTLYLLHTGDSSNDIYMSCLKGSDWTKNATIKGQFSKSAVSVAVYNNRIHMVHLGDSSNHLWWSVFDGDCDNLRWSSNTRIRCQLSQSAPALAVHGGLLHMIHQGDTSNTIWWSVYDGKEWTPNLTIPAQKSKAMASLCETPDQSKLVMLHLGDSSNKIWLSTL